MPNANDDKLVTLEDLKAAFDDVDSRTGVTGVKGNSESTYRQGDVNITPANIGAVNKAGDTMTGPLNITGYLTATGEVKGKGRIHVDNVSSTYNYGFVQYDDTVRNVPEAVAIIGYCDSRYLQFRERNPSTAYYENYNLPVPTADTENKTYSILTTKNTVGVPQGGTGGTTPEEARTNIGAVSRYGDTISGSLKLNNADLVVANGYLKGADENGAILNHALKLGHSGDNIMQFIEYSGDFAFYYTSSGSYTPVFIIRAAGESAAPLGINNGGTGASTAADARASLETIGSKATEVLAGSDINAFYNSMSNLMDSMEDHEGRLIDIHTGNDEIDSNLLPANRHFTGIFTRTSSIYSSGLFSDQVGRVISVYSYYSNNARTWGVKRIDS